MSDVQRGTIPCPDCGAPLAFESILSGGASAAPDYFDHQIIGLGPQNECPTCGRDYDNDASLSALDTLCDRELARLEAKSEGYPG